MENSIVEDNFTPTVVFVDKHVDYDLMEKTDLEIVKFIADEKKWRRLYDRLPDRGDKRKETLRRYEAELEQRNKRKSRQEVYEADRFHDDCWERQSAAAGDVEVIFVKDDVDYDLMKKTDLEINKFIADEKKWRKYYDMMPDRGDKLKESLRRYEAELERRNKRKSRQEVYEADQFPDDRGERQTPVAGDVEAPLAKRLHSGREYSPCDCLPDEDVDYDLMMKTDLDINKYIADGKKWRRLYDKMPDGGDKLKETLRRYEAELERRNKRKSSQEVYEADRFHDDRGERQTPVAGDVEAPLAKRLHSGRKYSPCVCLPEDVEYDLMLKTDLEINKFIADEKKWRRLYNKMPDGGDKLKETLQRYEAELERRNKRNSSQEVYEADRFHDDRVERQTPVAGDVEAPLAKRLHSVRKYSPCDCLPDEKMRKIIDELVLIGLSGIDVGKAAENCYNDPVKFKVFFTLPSHMRKDYASKVLVST